MIDMQLFTNYLKHEINDIEEARFIWSYFNKHLYLNKLYDYYKNVLKNAEIYTGKGNLNSSIVFVFSNLEEQEKYIKYFKDIFPKINIDFNSIYYTIHKKSKYKGETADKIYDQLLEYEINSIKPKIVYLVCETSANINADIIKIDKNIINKIIEISSLNNQTEEQIKELNNNKKIFWDNLKHIYKYYSKL